MSEEENFFDQEKESLYIQIHGCCGSRIYDCPDCGAIYDREYVDRNHRCKCGRILYCTEPPADRDIGAIGFDRSTGKSSGRCIRHMSEYEHSQYKKRVKSSIFPEFRGHLGDIQTSLMNSEEYGSIKPNAVIAELRMREVVNRINNSEPSSVVWERLSEYWNIFISSQKKMTEIQQANMPEDIKAGLIENHREAMKDSLKNVGELINRGHDDEGNWDEVLSLNNNVASLKKFEAQRLNSLGSLISPNQMTEILLSVRSSVLASFDDTVQRLERMRVFTIGTNTEDIREIFVDILKKNISQTNALISKEMNNGRPG